MVIETEYSGRDRRRFRRINRSFVARVSPHRRDEWAMAFIRNISKGGVLFSADREYKPGTIECSAEVIRCQAVVETQIYEMAVKFTKIFHEDVALVEKSIEDYLRMLENVGGSLA